MVSQGGTSGSKSGREEITAERLAALAAPHQDSRGNATAAYFEALLIFRVGTTWLAVDANQVDEICDQGGAIAVPGAPNYVPGMVNVRGHAVPLVDLQAYLGLPGNDAEGSEAYGLDETERGRVVLVTAGGMRVGLLCRQVRALEQVPSTELRPPDAVQGHPLNQVIRAERTEASGVTLVLDVPALLEVARVRR